MSRVLSSSNTLQTFRFSDKDDYHNDIFSILSSAHQLGKRDSRRHSTKSVSERMSYSDGNNSSNVRSLILSFCDRERA